MKIVLTGSLGHISKPLALELIEKGHNITVISSNPEKRKQIEDMGAHAAIGSVTDLNFLCNTFSGADLVYCMVPPLDFSLPIADLFDAYTGIAENYVQAIIRTGVRKVVDLSTVGAHMENGNGLLRYAYLIEAVFNRLPGSVGLKIMRPIGFYYNLLAFIPQIKNQGSIMSNYGGSTQKPWVSPVDIAAAVAAAILSPFEERSIQYIVSEEISCNQIAAVLGAAIGQPALEWTVLPAEQVRENLIQAGMAPSTAQGMVEMNAGMASGILYEDYKKHQPYRGKVSMQDFALEFARIYHQ